MRDREYQERRRALEKEYENDLKLIRAAHLRQAIRNALPQLPEIFDRKELQEVLGFEPPRSSLVRILREMDQEVAIEHYSDGRVATKYRKVVASHPAEG